MIAAEVFPLLKICIYIILNFQTSKGHDYKFLPRSVHVISPPGGLRGRVGKVAEFQCS